LNQDVLNRDVGSKRGGRYVDRRLAGEFFGVELARNSSAELLPCRGAGNESGQVVLCLEQPDRLCSAGRPDGRQESEQAIAT
jgi:hypothetical protein